MKISKIFWGLAFIAIAVLLILNALGVLSPISSVFGEITFWQVVGGIALLVAIVSSVATGEIGGAIVLLGFMFMLFERNIAHVFLKGGNDNVDLINNWLVFGCSLLLAAGFSMLKPQRWKRKYRKNKKKRKSEGFSGIKYEKCNNMGASEIYIDCAEFGTEYTEQSVKNRFGALEVHFENADSYKGGATLNIDNEFGAMEIHIPRSWKIKHDVKCSLGALEIDHDDDSDNSVEDVTVAPILHVVGEVHLGAVEIERI